MFQYGMMRLVDSNKILLVRLFEMKSGTIIDPNNNRFFFALQRRLGGKKGASFINNRPYAKRCLYLLKFS